MSPVKEMHWFDKNDAFFRRQLAARVRQIARKVEQTGARLTPRESSLVHRLSLRSDEDYLSFFSVRTTPEHRAFGEFTPSYALLDAADFRHIASVHQPVRFLFIMRNPVDRLWSHLKLHHKRNGKALPDRVEPAVLERLHAMGRDDYGRTLDALRAAVPESSVFACFYEDVFHPERGPTTVRALWECLGVTPIDLGARVETRSNVADGRPPTAQERSLLARLLADVYDWSARHFDRLPEQWERDRALLSA